jgi:hypothetical protein
VFRRLGIEGRVMHASQQASRVRALIGSPGCDLGATRGIDELGRMLTAALRVCRNGNVRLMSRMSVTSDLARPSANFANVTQLSGE